MRHTSWRTQDVSTRCSFGCAKPTSTDRGVDATASRLSNSTSSVDVIGTHGLSGRRQEAQATGWWARPASTASGWSGGREEALRLAATSKREYEEQDRPPRPRPTGSSRRQLAYEEGRPGRHQGAAAAAVAGRDRARPRPSEATRLIDFGARRGRPSAGSATTLCRQQARESRLLNGTLRSVGRGRHQLRTPPAPTTIAAR